MTSSNIYAKHYRRRAPCNQSNEECALITYDDDDTFFSIVKTSRLFDVNAIGRAKLKEQGRIYNIRIVERGKSSFFITVLTRIQFNQL